MKAIGERIRERRKKLGWTVLKLATLAELDSSFVSRLERGLTSASADSLIKVSGALGVSASSFFSSSSNVEHAEVGFRRIPVLDYVQAGKWTGVDSSFGDEEMRETILTDLEHPPSTFAMRLRGDSMEPEFSEGDVVVIDPTIQPRPGDFVVATDVNGEATFKQYRHVEINAQGAEVFELHALNPLYGRMRSDRQPIAIVGVMVEYRGFRRR